MNLNRAQDALKTYFGYDEFRPMQADIIENVYDRRDALVLMPTGGGKSMCYQIPAVTMPGTTLVVSPLIALMKDQVEGMRSNGIKAAYLNSSLTSHEFRQVENDLFEGNLDALYVSPEKLLSDNFLPYLKRANINLIAIDEAHCVSNWGHDFRPEYVKMGDYLKRTFPNAPFLALTATADKVTRRDIIRQMQLNEPRVFISSFDRPNLSLTVKPGQKRLEQMEKFLKNRRDESGIVYCFSRRDCENVAATLVSRGFRADYYHAGLDSRERDRVQENFIQDKTQIICATIAFGMGIDKSNVRWIIHYSMPGSIESYYQEIGRAGRDGVNADTLLFYSYGDVLNRQKLWENGGTANMDTRKAKMDRMYQYATAQQCRRRILLSYFGEHLPENCGNCDVCKNPPTYFDGTVLAQKAISCALRVRERVAMNLLINILRGSRAYSVLAGGYDKVKTYGVGKDLSFEDWRAYVEQMINDGLLEVVIDENKRLRVTEAGKNVVYGRAKVQLVDVQEAKRREAAAKQEAKRTRKEAPVGNESADLFEKLRQLRTRLARERGVAPYLVFNDATLHDMVRRRPKNDEQMREVSGVGEQKLRNYGEDFLHAIFEFEKSDLNKIRNTNGKISTLQITYDLLKSGKSVSEVSQQRAIGESGIFNHLAQLYEMGKDVDIRPYITQGELRQVLNVLKDLPEPYKLRDVHDALDGQFDYNKIRLGLAYCNRQERVTP